MLIAPVIWKKPGAEWYSEDLWIRFSQLECTAITISQKWNWSFSCSLSVAYSLADRQLWEFRPLFLGTFGKIKGSYLPSGESGFAPSALSTLCAQITGAHEMVKDWTGIFTGRNEVVAKVIFLHLSVILFTGGGVCLSACWDTIPPGADPPGADTPPQSRHPPLEQTPPGQTPPGADTPQSRHPPPEKQTPAYGQWAASTHPTGMHPCVFWLRLQCLARYNSLIAEDMSSKLSVTEAKWWMDCGSRCSHWVRAEDRGVWWGGSRGCRIFPWIEILQTQRKDFLMFNVNGIILTQ